MLKGEMKRSRADQSKCNLMSAGTKGAVMANRMEAKSCFNM